MTDFISIDNVHFIPVYYSGLEVLDKDFMAICKEFSDFYYSDFYFI